VERRVTDLNSGDFVEILHLAQNLEIEGILDFEIPVDFEILVDFVGTVGFEILVDSEETFDFETPVGFGILAVEETADFVEIFDFEGKILLELKLFNEYVNTIITVHGLDI